MDCKYLEKYMEIVYNLNHDRFNWSFKLFLVINVLSKPHFLFTFVPIMNDYTEFIFVPVKINNSKNSFFL